MIKIPRQLNIDNFSGYIPRLYDSTIRKVYVETFKQVAKDQHKKNDQLEHKDFILTLLNVYEEYKAKESAEVENNE